MRDETSRCRPQSDNPSSGLPTVLSMGSIDEDLDSLFNDKVDGTNVHNEASTCGPTGHLDLKITEPQPESILLEWFQPDPEGTYESTLERFGKKEYTVSQVNADSEITEPKLEGGIQPDPEGRYEITMNGFEKKESAMSQLTAEEVATQGAVQSQPVSKVWVEVVNPAPSASPKVYTEADYENAAEVQSGSESYIETEVKPEAIAEVIAKGDGETAQYVAHEINTQTMPDSVIEAKAADTSTDNPSLESSENGNSHEFQLKAETKEMKGVVKPELMLKVEVRLIDPAPNAYHAPNTYHEAEYENEASSEYEFETEVKPEAVDEVENEGDQNITIVTKNQIMPHAKIEAKAADTATDHWVQFIEGNFGTHLPKEEPTAVAFQADNMTLSEMRHPEEPVVTVGGSNDKEVAAEVNAYPDEEKPMEAVRWCGEEKATAGVDAESDVVVEGLQTVTSAVVKPKAQAEKDHDVAAEIETEIMPDAVIKAKSVLDKIQPEFEGSFHCAFEALKEDGSAELQFNSVVEEMKGVAEPHVVGCADTIHGDIQSRMALILKARKKEDQMKKREVEQRIKAGGDKVGYVDPRQGDIQSRLALKLQTRKVEERRRKREEEERIEAGGDKVGYVDPIQGDIQLRMALTLKARKKEELRRKREEEERFQAGGYKSGHVDSIQGDIQYRMALKLKARKAEERRRKREEEEHIKAGGHKVGYVDSIEGDIQSRMAHELKARKMEEQRRKREEEERIKAGSYKMGFVDSIEGDIQSRMALKLKARKIEEQKRKREEAERIKSGGSLNTLLRNTGLCMALKPKIKNSEDNQKYRGALKGKESGGVIDTAHGNALVQMSHELQTRRAEERAKMFRMESDAELLALQALQGRKNEAMGQFASDQAKKGRGKSSVVYTAELNALEGKRSEAVKQFANRQTGGENLRSSQSQTVTELAALQGKRKEAEEQLKSSCDDSSSSSIKSSPSPVTAELAALQGKRDKARARLNGIRDDNRRHSISSIQSTVCAELGALKGKKKEALDQYAIAKEQGNEDNWRDILSRNDFLLSSTEMERSDVSRHEVVYSPSITRSPSFVTAELRAQSLLDAELTELEGKKLRSKSPFRNRIRIAEQNKDPNIQSPVPNLRYQSSLTAELADLKGKKLRSKSPFRGRIQTTKQSKDPNIQSPLAAELKALRGKKKKSMNEYLTFKGNGDECLQNRKSRNAKHIIVERKDGITLPLSETDRKSFQVKRVFDLVDKDHRDCIGRDEINLLLIVFGKTSGKKCTPAEIDGALNQVDAEGCGRIGFESFYSMYTNLGFK